VVPTEVGQAVPTPAPLGPAPLVYLITDRTVTGGRALDEVIAQALRALSRPSRTPAAVAVQLRERDLPAAALLSLARRLRAVTAHAGVRLFVNDRVDVALAVGADGVHLGHRSMDVADVRTLAPSLQIAVSTHALAEVQAAANSGQVSFVVFGPVFDTPSKRIYGPPLGLEPLRQACAVGIPVVAIGGIEVENVAPCRRSGASGIACIRAVLRNADPEAALSRFFGAIEST
jgi:thiamine-phosphate pyrophosphorylase